MLTRGSKTTSKDAGSSSSNPELSPSPHRKPPPSTTAPPSRTYALSLSTVDDIFPAGVCSVFPMEACEILGGEACNARMFPEAKLAAAAGSGGRPASEEIDRDYLEYNDPKTVFPGEACDDLGGEFCQAEYQNGVF